MKKTNTINLGGIIFHIEEDAYTQLQNYLNAIHSYFSTSEEKEEIIADIESRIAEILQEKKIRIITTSQVDEVIAIMGKPEDFGDGEQDEKITKPLEKEKRLRKIFRHPDDKILGGVCGGLSAYFNMDPILFRLGFLLTTLFGGFGFVVYLILWVIAPLADRASDHLEMRGDPITVETIGLAVASKIKDTVVNKNNQSMVRKILAGIGSVFEFLIEVLKRPFVILGKNIKPLIGIILLILTIFFGIYGITHFSKESQIEEMTTLEMTTLENVKSDTLRISLNEHDNFFWDEQNMRIVETEDGKHKLISYHFFIDSEKLHLDQYLEIPGEDPYQKQSVELTLLVPTGKSIYLDESLKYFIYDIKNVTNTHDYKMVGHYWTMIDEGLFSQEF